jgi:hypothetical protein
VVILDESGRAAKRTKRQERQTKKHALELSVRRSIFSLRLCAFARDILHEGLEETMYLAEARRRRVRNAISLAFRAIVGGWFFFSEVYEKGPAVLGTPGR